VFDEIISYNRSTVRSLNFTLCQHARLIMLIDGTSTTATSSIDHFCHDASARRRPPQLAVDSFQLNHPFDGVNLPVFTNVTRLAVRKDKQTIR
jgi:hypothetical protein